MRTRIRKWENIPAVRIPAFVMRAAHLDLGGEVDVREERGRIVVAPVRLRNFDLDTLLKRITSKNRHEAVEFGPEMGKDASS